MLAESELNWVLEQVESASAIAEEASRRHFGVQSKDDQSPVTDIDLAISDFLCSALIRKFPQISLTGEENSYEQNQGSSFRWFLDPIDGTKDLIQRTGQWSILLGLVQDGAPIWGVVAQPSQGLLYWGGPSSGSWKTEKKGTKERLMRKDSSERVQSPVIIDSKNHPDPALSRIKDRFQKPTFYQYGSIGLKLAQIAENRADLYFNSSRHCKLWDTCAGEALLTGAGGVVLDTEGVPLKYQPELAAIQKTFFACGPEWTGLIES